MNKTISKKQLKKEVTESKGVLVVQFKTEWSGACQIILPIYEELAGSFDGKARFYTVDVERETGIDREYGVTELPTILFFRNGNLVDYIRGLAPKEVMARKVETAITNE